MKYHISIYDRSNKEQDPFKFIDINIKNSLGYIIDTEDIKEWLKEKEQEVEESGKWIELSVFSIAQNCSKIKDIKKSKLLITKIWDKRKKALS